MDAEFEAARRCDTCGATPLTPWLTRSDGLAVLQCPGCGTGVVECIPLDLDALYAGDYYARPEGDGHGYSDYAYTAEHSVGWASALVEALRPEGGRVVDVGCADGLLLAKLPERYERWGVETNLAMVEVCRQRGIAIPCMDVYDDAALRPLHGTFDVVTAVAVLEHVPEFARALRQLVDLARPDGVVLFEVPLISETEDNEAWLTSSLEHLYYPTVQGLRHLVVDVLGMHLAGGELPVRGYASTFVGLVARDATVAAAAGEVWSRVTGPDGDGLTAAEARARVHTLLVHAAHHEPGVVGSLAVLPPQDVNPAVLRRIGELWADDAEARGQTEELRDYLVQVEQARDAAGAQAAEWERVAHDHYRQLRAIVTSPAWRALRPVRGGLRVAARGRDELALVKPYVNRRRLRATVDLLRSGDVAAVRQRVRAVRSLAAVSAGVVTSRQTGPRVPVVQEAWPADRPLVSVVIVCFNYGRFVGEALASVLDQTLPGVEVIVVDGGSDDGETPDQLRELAAQHPEVRFEFRDGRHLVGDNRNHGIAVARGRYVCCLDADDRLHPLYLELAAYLLERHDYDVVGTSTRTFGLREETFGVLERPDLEDMLLGNNVCTAAVVRRELWERAGGFHDTGLGAGHIHEDWKLWVRVAALGARIINIIGQPLFLYRTHGDGSLSNLEGVPDLAEQRRAIADFNADVITPEAYALSKRRRDEVHVVEHGSRNLVEPARDGAVTVLLAMPFLIVGGAERLLSSITAHLAGRGFRIVIVTTVPVDPQFGDTTGWFADATHEVHHLPRTLDPALWADHVDHLVVTKRVDVVWQVGSEFVYALLPTLRQRHPHLTVVDLLFNTVGHVRNHAKHLTDIDLTLVENAEVQRYLLEHGEPAERVRLVESGVDLEAYSPPVRAPRAGLRAGFSGRLSEEKDPYAFVDIAVALRDRADVQLVMTGAGPLEAGVRSRLGRAGNLSFLGMVDDVRAHLAGLDVLVLPSRLDGRPVVVLEALALGLPVVASRVGALPDLVQDGVSGFLCEPGDVAAFADRLRWLADHPDDRTRMGQAARAFAEEHLDARLMQARYEQALHEVVGR